MRTRRALLLLLVATLGWALAGPAASGQEAWKTPPLEVLRILEARPNPVAVLDPGRTAMLLVDRVGLPPLADIAAPMVPLGGVRLNPRTGGLHGVRRYSGLTLVGIATRRETRVPLPEGANISAPQFSPDGARFAFTLTRPDGIELWVGESATGASRAVTARRVNAALGPAFRWLPDSRHVLVKLVPEDRGPAPERPLVPAGPDAQETAGKKAPARTFPDLLQDAFDEALFDHYMRAVLARVDVESASVVESIDCGAGRSILDFDVSPDGKKALVHLVRRPYSRLVPCDSFAEDVVVLDLGREGARTGQDRLLVAELPVRDETPIQGVEACPRAFDWCDTEAETLIWLEALDGGDPRRKVPHRDRVVALDVSGATGDGPAAARGREIFRTEHRCTDLSWLEGGGLLATEYDRDRRWTRTWHHDAAVIRALPPGEARPAPRLVFDRSAQDRYGAPGTPLTTRTAAGRAVVRMRAGAIYLAGPGASPEGDRPFIDRMVLADGATTRLYRSPGAGTLDRVIDVLSPDAEKILITRESPTSPANFLVLAREAGGGYAGSGAPLTAFTDPSAEVRRYPPRLLTYARADGVTLSARLYVPPTWTPGGARVPLLVWAYPLEYNDPRTAGQVSGSPLEYAPFTGLSPLLLLTQGYAVLDGAAMPVIGDPETVNDTFVEQIAASARAAIAVAAREGVADPDRCAIAGHSYGAFMTANLLAHTDLFRAGVARSGAYNRSLTPFGFQGERRSYWEATEAYGRMSPFTYANRIDEPLLMIHGRLDSNTGTFPIQSERLFHAIQGNGGTARLVMLPFENHGYAARESILETQAETIQWLDRHVKNAGPRKGVER